jgi:competence protein ComEC
LREHIAARLPEGSAGIAIALVTGDQNAVDQDDADAMRRGGLTHLLSVSGLHIAAVVAFAMLLTLKLLALSERLALRFNLVLVAAAVAAAAGIGYTLLTGAQVPTVRSCVAALLILAGVALGRDAISIRLIATGALIVLLFRPEALAGPSFQMSFGAVTAIVALHSTTWARRLLQRREEGIIARTARALAGIIGTGLAVEIALMPLALYHFHRSGLYGVGANIVAIPLTTFVIMPLEAGALLLDAIGWGKPLWFLCGGAIDGLLKLAHAVASSKGAIALLPSMPGWTFTLMVVGGIWLCLWTMRIRLLGLAPVAIGAMGAAFAPAPDLLRHRRWPPPCRYRPRKAADSARPRRRLCAQPASRSIRI